MLLRSLGGGDFFYLPVVWKRMEDQECHRDWFAYNAFVDASVLKDTLDMTHK